MNIINRRAALKQLAAAGMGLSFFGAGHRLRAADSAAAA